MPRCLRLLVIFCALVGASAGVAAASPAQVVVVAIRYLQPKGTSHSHLYLYRADGKLLRQLTKDDSGQDFDPIFAPDGETIVFSREVPDKSVEFWSVNPGGGDLKRLEAAPDWYTATRTSPFFTNIEHEAEATAEDAPPRTYRAPDDSVEVVVRRLPEDEDDSVNGEGTGKHFLLRDLKAGTETEMGTLPGFLGLWDVLALKGTRDQAFLLEGPLRVVFFGLHLDSTSGDTSFALDLNQRRLIRLSPNWAAPIPLPGEPAFLTLTYVRYVPIPRSKKTANCTYLERWDAKLEKVRYAREGTAAICYGTSLYRPANSPAVVTIRRDAD
jgi:hypothetical protein